MELFNPDLQVHVTPERRVHIASRSGQADTVREVFLQYPNLDINSVHEGGVWTALHEACDFGHRDVYQILAAHPRIEMNKPDNQGRTGLFWAAHRGRTEIVWDLVNDKRVNINQPNARNETPLWKAVQCQHISVVKRILASPNDVDMTSVADSQSDQPGMGLLDVAKSTANQPMIMLIGDYLEDKNKVRFRLRRELGLQDSLSAELFALIVFFCDDYLQIKPKDPAHDGESKHFADARRFMVLVRELPMDLQMVLCNKVYGSNKSLILTKNSEPAFVNLSKTFAEEKAAVA